MVEKAANGLLEDPESFVIDEDVSRHRSMYYKFKNIVIFFKGVMFLDLLFFLLIIRS